ncbi:MAG: phage holin family protein [Desulfobacterales bacterium]
MHGLFIRWIILTVAILVTSLLLDGIRVSGFLSAVFTAALLGILNAFFRPVLILLTLPITILTMGLFMFVINAVLLMMASGAVPGFEVNGFWSAVFGSIIIGLISWILNLLINQHGRIEYIRFNRFDN